MFTTGGGRFEGIDVHTCYWGRGGALVLLLTVFVRQFHPKQQPNKAQKCKNEAIVSKNKHTF